jgi:pimeloyl-ACP methyl ester carboxylesterase
MFARLITLAVLLTALTFPAHAEEVTLTHKGLTLNAKLELAKGKQLKDGVILITHGTLAHNDMEMLVYLREVLHERGYNTLAINLSLGVNNRHGMYECATTHRHQHEDAVGEIAAWVDWLGKRGVKQVTVLGHSRGGAQTARYAGEHDQPIVKAVVLLAPATLRDDEAGYYQKTYGKPLVPLLDRARQLVKDGKGDTVMKPIDILYCPGSSATAASFASYHGAGPNTDTPTLLAHIRKPVLVVVAASDEVVVGLEKKVAPLNDGKRIRMKVVEGADHFFRDLFTDDAVESIDAFLKAMPK